MIVCTVVAIAAVGYLLIQTGTIDPTMASGSGITSIKKAEKYSIGTTHLVNQGFVSSHWSGLGSSLFSENSMNPITPDQLAMLMEEDLDTQSFHALYKSFTVQKKKVPAFGLIVDNPKLLSENN